MSLMFAPQGSDPAELLAGTKLLGGLYQIEEPLQRGGFALTYIARDSLDRHVVIKECFPAELCIRRDGNVLARDPSFEQHFQTLKQQFLREARGVATLKHPDVVAVHQVFEQNNTAYMALDYVAGMDLISVLDDEPERLDAVFIETTLVGTLKALRHIHANGILHRDIAPDNIRVDGSDRITLIDFGAAGTRGAKSGATEGVLPSVKDGYSPPEFYKHGEVQDFSSDLYSLGATFHHLITGQVPADGQSRRQSQLDGAPDPYQPLAEGQWNCGYHVLVTIDRALSLVREERLQSADLWLELLETLPRERPVPPAPLVFDPLLDEKISELVQSVNQFLTADCAVESPVDPAQMPAATATVPSGAPEAKRRLIYPNYDDLSLPEAFAAPAAPAQAASAPPEKAETRPVRKSFFSSLFSRHQPKNPETCVL